MGIGGHQDREAIGGRGAQQFTVAQLRPPAFVCGDDFMMYERVSERGRRTLIEQNTHLRGCKRASCCVLQHSANLFDRDAWEPLHELRNLRAALQIFEQGSDWNSRSRENPGAADSLRIALYCRTRGPIDHRQILPSPRRYCYARPV